MIVIGIDPGKKGGLVVLEDGNFVDCLNMPLVSKGKSKTPSQLELLDRKEKYKKYKDWYSSAELDIDRIADFIDCASPDAIVVERLGFRGKQTGLATMADNYALLYQAIGQAGELYRPIRVDAKTWAKAYPTSKGDRKAYCHELGWMKITNEGLTDAALIAHWWATKDKSDV